MAPQLNIGPPLLPLLLVLLPLLLLVLAPESSPPLDDVEASAPLSSCVPPPELEELLHPT
jgi:hypothetical protein